MWKVLVNEKDKLQNNMQNIIPIVYIIMIKPLQR